MSKRFDENRIRELVRLGNRTTSVPAGTEARVLAAIRERTAARPRRSIFTLVRYQPVFGLAALAIVLVPLLVVAGGALLAPADPGALQVVSARGGSLVGRPKALSPGESVRENAVIRTGPEQHTGLESAGRFSLQLFSNSEIKITALSDGRMDVALRGGSLYLHKLGKGESAARVRLTVDAYTFTLLGTRIFAAVDDRRRITLLCYDGLVEAVGAAASFSIPAGDRAVIEPDGAWRVTENGIAPGEYALDAELKNGLPRDRAVRELVVTASAGGGRETLPESGRDGGTAPPPYDVTAVGSIAARGAVAGEVAFYASAGAGGRMFLINREAVFTLDRAGLRARPGLVADASFRVRPASGGDWIAFSTPQAVTIVEASSLKATATLPLPAEGTIDHNFTPRIEGRHVYLPVQNLGYFRADADRPSSPVLFAREPFPVTPFVRGETVFIGTYYNGYWGGVSADGTTVFRTALKGNGFTNPVSADGSFFLCLAEKDRPVILRLDEAGRETGRYPLARPASADLVAVGETICGIDTAGGLFMTDVRSGKTTALITLFRKALTTRQWRNVGLAAAGRLVYAPTDDGRIVVADAVTKTVADVIVMPGKETFFTAPFAFDNAYYAVANSGTVYRIVKNER